MLTASEGHSLVSVGGMLSLFTVGGSVSAIVWATWWIGSVLSLFIFFPLPCPPRASFCSFMAPGGNCMPSHFERIPTFGHLVSCPGTGPEDCPKGRSLVSSIVMGLALGTAGSLMPLTGMMADAFSIRAVLSCIALIPLAALILIYYLPEPGDSV